MARIRTIKLDYWQDIVARSLSREVRGWFPGLKNLADDEGRLRYDPRMIRCQLNPSDDDVTDETVTGWLADLRASGALVIYNVNGDSYIQISCDSVFWDERVSHPSPSKFPPIPEPSGEVPEGSREFPDDSGGFPSGEERSGVDRRGGESPPEDSGEDSGEEATKEKKEEEKPPPSLPKFDEYHPAYKVAYHLRERLYEWRPTFANLPPATPEGLEGWATDIDLAIRLDKRNPDEMMALIDWLHDSEQPGNDGFRWRDQIRSGKKLREKYDDLELSKTRQEKAKRRGNSKPGLKTTEGDGIW